jgi:hypothetical protein
MDTRIFAVERASSEGRKGCRTRVFGLDSVNKSRSKAKIPQRVCKYKVTWRWALRVPKCERSCFTKVCIYTSQNDCNVKSES